MSESFWKQHHQLVIQQHRKNFKRKSGKRVESDCLQGEENGMEVMGGHASFR